MKVDYLLLNLMFTHIMTIIAIAIAIVIAIAIAIAIAIVVIFKQFANLGNF